MRYSVNTVPSNALKIMDDPYFFDFAPFFADLVAFFFAAILLYIEKGTYISFLIIKIKKIDLANPGSIFSYHILKQGL